MVKTREKKALPILLAALCSLFILSFTPSVQAQGGTPTLTDDPGMPGDGRWEVNFLSTLERSRTGWLSEIPNIDVNYGLGSHLEIKFKAPWLVMKESGEQAKAGLGNSMLGVKWRFLDEERNGVAMSTYPQLELNTSTRSVARGLVARGMRLFLPVQAVKFVGPVEVNGEIGYRIVQHGPDEWEYGFAIARQVTKRVELNGELHGSALRTLREDELFFNVGSRVRLSRNAALLFSAGRTIRNAGNDGPQYIATFGIQFNFRKRVLTAWKDK